MLKGNSGKDCWSINETGHTITDSCALVKQREIACKGRLARDLLNEAETDKTLPTPVVLNLSPWAQNQEPLETWIVERQKIEYGVSRKLGETWVKAD